MNYLNAKIPKRYLYFQGVMKACDILLERMEPIKKTLPNASWEEIVKECYKEYVNLCATSM